MAARLAIAGHKVLLIDAGDDQGNATRQMVPALQLQSTEYEPMRWDYFVHHYSDLTRQEEDSKMTYRTPTGDFHVGPNPPANSEPLGILYPRAGTLGGCSAHNAMMSVKSHPVLSRLWHHILISYPVPSTHMKRIGRALSLSPVISPGLRTRCVNTSSDSNATAMYLTGQVAMGSKGGS